MQLRSVIGVDANGARIRAFSNGDFVNLED
jgi:hypothetical protein